MRGLSVYMHAPVLTHDLTREESPNGGHKPGWPDRPLGLENFQPHLTFSPGCSGLSEGSTAFAIQ